MTCAMRMAQPCHNGGTSVPSQWAQSCHQRGTGFILETGFFPVLGGYRLISARLIEAARSHRSWWSIPPRKDAPPLPADCFVPHAIRYQTTRRVYSGRWRSGSSLGRLRGSLSLGSIGREVVFIGHPEVAHVRTQGKFQFLDAQLLVLDLMRALRCSRFRLKPSKRLIPMVTP